MATKRNGDGTLVEKPPREVAAEPRSDAGTPAAQAVPVVPDPPRGNAPDGFLRPPPRPPIPVMLRPDGYAILPEGNPCEGCDHCCRYVAIEIDKPTTKKDFEHIRWYLLHRSISIIIDWDGAWLIQFDTPCEWLVDGRCSHYELRPNICREYDPAECERYLTTTSHRVLMKTEADLRKYMEEREVKLAARRRARAEREAASSRGSGRKSPGVKSKTRKAARAGAAGLRAGSRSRGRAPSGR
jgi:Fe-S-cluster containining protein